MADCYLSSKVNDKERASCDHGFMGRTHATSAVAVFLFGVAFFPVFTERALGTDDIWVVILAAIATAGASLVPDLDNTSSTSRNSLGPVGHIMSEAFRLISSIIQTTIRTSRDDATPNPHRGFFHTIPASLLLGAGVLALTRITSPVELPAIGKTTWGHVAALIIVFALLHLALSGLAKPLMKDIGKSTPFGEIVAFVVSFGLAYVLFIQAPQNESYWWLGVAMFAGCVVHILGDAFTTAGVPILFPIPRKGKMWWNVRFTSIKAGGVVENVVFVPFFCIVILIASLRILGLY